MYKKEIQEQELINLIRSFISRSVENKSVETREYNQYTYKGLEIKVSFGVGRLSKVSWMLFLGKNQKVSKGIYPLILFDRDNCLALTYGISETDPPVHMWNNSIIENFPSISISKCECNLNSIKEKYPSSLLKKCFKLENSTLTESQIKTLIANLNEIIDEYKKILSLNKSNVTIMTIKEIADKINIITRGKQEPISLLPEIRAKCKGVKKVPNAIFSSNSIKGHYAFHYGGRKELQFNIGEDNGGFKYGIAFSIQGSREIPDPVSFFKAKIDKFNKLIEESRFTDVFSKLHMWAYINKKRTKNYKVGKIPEEWIKNGVFIFIGKWEKEFPKNDNDIERIISTFNELLPVYIAVECNDNEAKKWYGKIITINCINLKIKFIIKHSFYNSLKTKGFVILAGLSGTGKTKIFEEFVKCFPENNSLFFSIRPDFKDSKALLGFYNPLKKEYHSTPLLEFILNASENYLQKGKNADPFFVLFDEMNLARVEYYFADFLSILETKKFDNKEDAVNNPNFQKFLQTFKEQSLNDENHKFTSQSIKLHNENIENIPKELFLPPNLYFIGTVNIDETTYMFSPKVLDRAFTIEFDVENFTEYLEFIKSPKNAEIEEDLKNILKQDFTNNGNFAYIDKTQIKEFVEKNPDVVKLLNEVNSILKKYNLHFGYRVFDEIIMFLYNSRNSVMKMNTDEALDIAMKMKLLPKFNGTRQKLEKPIKEFLNKLGIEGSTPEELIKTGIPSLKEVPGKTKYKHTAQKLLEMLYKLKSQGFAAFI